MSRFTAKEAKELAGPTLDEKIDLLLESIKNRATEGHRYIATGRHHDSHSDLWIQGGYDMTDDWQEAKKVLEDLGYNVKFYYNESQFVDMYTKVSW